jgi:hypothetical protein
VHYDGMTPSVTNESTSAPGTPSNANYQLDAAGAPKAVSAPPGPSQLTDDGKGNISTLTSTNGTPTCTARFDPFGSPQGAGAAPVCATGASGPNDIFYRQGRRDAATGDYQLGSRHYDPAKASFLTPDNYRGAPSGANLSGRAPTCPSASTP